MSFFSLKATEPASLNSEVIISECNGSRKTVFCSYTAVGTYTSPMQNYCRANCTQTITEMIQMERRNIQRVSSWDFSWHVRGFFLLNMSQSPSHRRDCASASPESPKEGDFSPRQFNDNPKSLEERETEDQKDPIVNNAPDDCSSSLLNARICAPLLTNDLGKLCAGMPLQEQSIKRSWLSWIRKSMTTVQSQAVYTLCIITTLSTPYRPSERIKPLQHTK